MLYCNGLSCYLSRIAALRRRRPDAVLQRLILLFSPHRSPSQKATRCCIIQDACSGVQDCYDARRREGAA